MSTVTSQQADHSDRPLDSAASTAMPLRVSVVVPARNEALNLPHVLPAIPADVHEIILVDGFSTDGTADVALSLDPRVIVVEQSRRGKGNALAHGFAAVTGDVIVMLDADCSADPAEIMRFVDALRNGADIAKGSRYIEGGGSSDLTFVRSFGNKALTTMVNVLFRTSYSDLCYGYNAFWTHCVPPIDLDSDGFEVETLINIRVARAGLKIVEVPSYERDRLHGSSNLKAWKDGLRVLRTIVWERIGRTGDSVVPTVERRRHARGSALPGAIERRAYHRHTPD